jgi:hypothetical protein
VGGCASFVTDAASLCLCYVDVEGATVLWKEREVGAVYEVLWVGDETKLRRVLFPGQSSDPP